jgi:hypothetical protein
MGRGRAKAKQTKVARELKYFSPDTNLTELERELHSSGGPGTLYSPPQRVVAPVEDDDDDYDRWATGGH